MLISQVGNSFVSSNRPYSYKRMDHKENNANDLAFKGYNLSGGRKKGLFVTASILLTCFFGGFLVDVLNKLKPYPEEFASMDLIRQEEYLTALAKHNKEKEFCIKEQIASLKNEQVSLDSMMGVLNQELATTEEKNGRVDSIKDNISLSKALVQIQDLKTKNERQKLQLNNAIQTINRLTIEKNTLNDCIISLSDHLNKASNSYQGSSTTSKNTLVKPTGSSKSIPNGTQKNQFTKEVQQKANSSERIGVETNSAPRRSNYIIRIRPRPIFKKYWSKRYGWKKDVQIVLD